MTKEPDKKQLGHAKEIYLHITGPAEMIDMTIELNMLTMFTSQNGVGKSLVMKLIWCMEMITQSVIAGQGDLKTGAQFILDHSVPDHNIALGAIGMLFESGARVVVQLMDGKVTSVEATGLESITDVRKPTFMSTDMRKFSAWNYYFAVRRNYKTPVERVMGMVKDFRLYDIMYIESILARVPIKLDDKIKVFLMGFGGATVPGVELDFQNDRMVIVDETGKTTNAETLSAGVQSLLNMAIASVN